MLNKEVTQQLSKISIIKIIYSKNFATKSSAPFKPSPSTGSHHPHLGGLKI